MKIFGYFLVKPKSVPLYAIISEYHNKLSLDIPYATRALMTDSFESGYKAAHKHLKVELPRGKRS